MTYDNVHTNERKYIDFNINFVIVLYIGSQMTIESYSASILYKRNAA